MLIKIKKHFLYYRNYKLKCSVGKSGIKKNKIEGDLSTPKGIFELGTLYYRKDRIALKNCKIKKKIIKKKMGWCDDIKSKHYNREIKLPFNFSSEKLYRKNKIYDIFINIKHNYNPVMKKKGSAIFLHICGPSYKKTKGCVALQKKDFLKIIPLITKRTKILIR